MQMTPAGLPILTIDGDRFEDLDGFAREFSTLLPDYTWRGSLDAFNDILRGGFGTPDDGFVLRWLNSARSRQALGWPATITWYERVLTTCHPGNKPDFQVRLEQARRQEGTTLFDWIVEIIRIHGPGGRESQGNVLLELC
jgi:hypothetical protein